MARDRQMVARTIGNNWHLSICCDLETNKHCDIVRVAQGVIAAAKSALMHKPGIGLNKQSYKNNIVISGMVQLSQ